MSAPRSPHALILPYPAQGHITPLMELSHCLADRGVRITFINTHFNHRLIFPTPPPGHAELAGGGEIDGIHFVSIPDGLEPGEDRHDLGRLTQSLAEVMPSFLEELMRRNDDAEFTCFIADVNMAWALKIAKSAGLRTAAFWPAAAGFLAAMFSIPELIRDGVIDEDGSAVKKEVIQLNPKLSPMDTTNLPWKIFNDAHTQKIIFNYIFANCEATCDADLIACNSFEKLEEPVFEEAPHILPIGPLLLPNNSTDESGGDPNLCHFWSSDKQCMAWLDMQPERSVIYVAFGSTAVFNSEQFQELALGLELTGRPFLWVVRPDLTNKRAAYPSGFEERVAGRGRMVAWSPQQKVLKHPAIACFVSHCGWNSTMEGVRNGVPFLCWPYFGDQLFNRAYITEVWKIGLSLVPDENGRVSKEEVGSKVEELLRRADILGRSQGLKRLASASAVAGGSSFENLNKLVDCIREI